MTVYYLERTGCESGLSSLFREEMRLPENLDLGGENKWHREQISTKY